MKSKIFISGVILVICVFAGKVRAEETLSWGECVEEAFISHPDLISARENLNQKRADKNIAKSALFPQVSGSVSGQTREKTTPGDGDNKTTTDSYSYSVSGSQLLFDGFKSASDLSSASKELTAFEYNYLVVSSDVRLQLRESFVGLLKAQELLSLSEIIAERRRKNLKLVRLRYAGGSEHKGALLTAEADLSQAEFEVSQAERSIELYQRSVLRELGRNKYSEIKVSGSFDVTENIEVSPEFESMADTTPLLKKLISLKEAAKYDVKSAKADFFPQVYFNSSIGRSDSEWAPRDKEWSAGVSFSVPIFEGGSRVEKVLKAESLLRQSVSDERSGRNDVIYTLAQTWIDLKDAVEELKVKEKYLEAIEERANIAGVQYSTGLISFDDWVIIEDNLVSARKSFLNAKANVLTKEAYWVQARGGTLKNEK